MLASLPAASGFLPLRRRDLDRLAVAQLALVADDHGLVAAQAAANGPAVDRLNDHHLGQPTVVQRLVDQRANGLAALDQVDEIAPALADQGATRHERGVAELA